MMHKSVKFFFIIFNVTLISFLFAEPKLVIPVVPGARPRVDFFANQKQAGVPVSGVHEILHENYHGELEHKKSDLTRPNRQWMDMMREDSLPANTGGRRKVFAELGNLPTNPNKLMPVPNSTHITPKRGVHFQDTKNIREYIPGEQIGLNERVYKGGMTYPQKQVEEKKIRTNNVKIMSNPVASNQNRVAPNKLMPVPNSTHITPKRGVHFQDTKNIREYIPGEQIGLNERVYKGGMTYPQKQVEEKKIHANNVKIMSNQVVQNQNKVAPSQKKGDKNIAPVYHWKPTQPWR